MIGERASALPSETTRFPLPFIEKPLEGNEPARCVDGRASLESPQGPQMLGGSLLPVFIKAIATDTEFNGKNIQSGFATLQNRGFTTGVHRGGHAHDDISDCGFADKMLVILGTAVDNQAEIRRRLTDAVDNHSLDEAYLRLDNYSEKNIKITGEALIQSAQQAGAAVETVQGDHSEEVAFVNLKPRVTFDTQAANQRGQQGFNLDLLEAVNQAEALGIDRDFAKALSLILYQVTEMVLVEQKSNPPLPVIIHR